MEYVLKISIGMKRQINASVRQILFGMERIVLNVQTVDIIIHLLDDANVRMDFGMAMYVERIV